MPILFNTTKNNFISKTAFKTDFFIDVASNLLPPPPPLPSTSSLKDNKYTFHACQKLALLRYLDELNEKHDFGALPNSAAGRFFGRILSSRQKSCPLFYLHIVHILSTLYIHTF